MDGKEKQGTFADGTRELARERARAIGEAFVAEVERLLRSGALDPDSHSRALVFGVALENMGDAYVRGDRRRREYKQLKRI